MSAPVIYHPPSRFYLVPSGGGWVCVDEYTYYTQYGGRGAAGVYYNIYDCYRAAGVEYRPAQQQQAAQQQLDGRSAAILLLAVVGVALAVGRRRKG